MKTRPLIIVSLVAVIITAGCSGIRPVDAPKKAAITEHSLDSNLHTIQGIVPHLSELDAEFGKLPRPGEQGRDYFNAQETDEIESL